MTKETDSDYVYLWVTDQEPALALTQAALPSVSGSGDLDADYAGATPNILGSGDTSSPRVIATVAVVPQE